jgi:hypothetical protein
VAIRIIGRSDSGFVTVTPARPAGVNKELVAAIRNACENND